MTTIQTPIGRVFYVRRGTGAPTIVAIHGAAGTSRQWGYQLRSLSQSADVVALDLPGHGRSGGAGLRSIGAGAAHVTAVLDALGIAQAVLLGHSMGGAIAQWFALHRPERVTGLILIGSAARLPIPATLLHDIRHAWPLAARRIVDLAYAPGTPDAALEMAINDLAVVDPAIVEADYQACALFDMWDNLPRITVPTLLLTGAADRFVPPALVAETAQQLAHAKLMIVPGAGHMPMIEQPERVNEAISVWLKAL